MNSSLAERFFNVISPGIHLGEFFLGREVFLTYSRQGFTWVNSYLAERFFNVLLARIHLGEFVLGREVF